MALCPYFILNQAQLVKNLPVIQETWVQSLGWKDPLEKGKAIHSSFLAWKIPQTVQSWGSKESDTTEQFFISCLSPTTRRPGSIISFTFSKFNCSMVDFWGIEIPTREANSTHIWSTSSRGLYQKRSLLSLPGGLTGSNNNLGKP